jgi:hypothetical protein
MYLTPSIEAQTSLPCTLEVTVLVALVVTLDDAEYDCVEDNEDVTVLLPGVIGVDETDDETVLVTVVDTLV